MNDVILFMLTCVDRVNKYLSWNCGILPTIFCLVYNSVECIITSRTSVFKSNIFLPEYPIIWINDTHYVSNLFLRKIKCCLIFLNCCQTIGCVYAMFDRPYLIAEQAEFHNQHVRIKNNIIGICRWAYSITFLQWRDSWFSEDFSYWKAAQFHRWTWTWTRYFRNRLRYFMSKLSRSLSSLRKLWTG